jgi:hypothetical protein
MRSRLVTAALAAALSLAATSGFAQTQPPQTNQHALSNDKAKSQQNSADEAVPKGDMEAAKDPNNKAKVEESGRKLEESAEKAKQKSDGAAGTTGTAKPQ